MASFSNIKFGPEVPKGMVYIHIPDHVQAQADKVSQLVGVDIAGYRFRAQNPPEDYTLPENSIALHSSDALGLLQPKTGYREKGEYPLIGRVGERLPKIERQRSWGGSYFESQIGKSIMHVKDPFGGFPEIKRDDYEFHDPLEWRVINVTSLVFDECDKDKPTSDRVPHPGLSEEDMTFLEKAPDQEAVFAVLAETKPTLYKKPSSLLQLTVNKITAMKPGQFYISGHRLATLVKTMHTVEQVHFVSIKPPRPKPAPKPPEPETKESVLDELARKIRGEEAKKEVPAPVAPKEILYEGQTFSEYMREKGFVGLPDDLDTTLAPLFALYGECREMALARGIKAEKGIILAGPPGTGKTTMARELATYLQCGKDQITFASAPELLGKWVGQNEENIRRLFAPARRAMERYGARSALYVIVIDEMDTIAGKRDLMTSSHEGSKVTQLLAEMDGLEELTNVLVIGMTNHVEMLDPALLRPGRFGTTIHVALPTLAERVEIFNVYLTPLVEGNHLSEDVKVEGLAKLTGGCSGADIRGLVERVNRMALSRLMKRLMTKEIPMTAAKTDPSGKVTAEDFRIAVAQQSNIAMVLDRSTKPSIPFREYLIAKGMVGLPTDLEAAMAPVFATFGPMKGLADDLRVKKEKGIVLAGPPGTGKTTMAKHIANYLECPESCIQLISGTEVMSKWVGGTESNIRDLFAPAIKAAKKLGEDSPPYVLVIDELDSIARARKLASGSHEASRVNQLLTELDGLNSSDNILVIGMTNHLEHVDAALLRPGRLGTTIHVGLPTQVEREQIFGVYMKTLLEEKRVDSRINVKILAQSTDGFSGADISGVVESAKRAAFNRLVALHEKEHLTQEVLRSHPSGILTLTDFVKAIEARAKKPVSKL